MIYKKALRDIENSKGNKIEQGEECEIVSVWINNTANDIYVKLKNKKGEFIITSIKSLVLTH